MKRSVGALLSCASSTSLTTRAIVLSDAAAVTRMRSAASPLMVPANTSSSMPLRSGRAFACHRRFVDGALARDDHAVRRNAVAGPHQDDRADLHNSRPELPRCWPSRLDQARFSAPAPSVPGCSRAPCRPRRLPAARRPGTGTRPPRASSPAPMMTAPTAAIVISISIVNGVPASAAMTARRAIGTRPTSMAAINAQGAMVGHQLADAVGRDEGDAGCGGQLAFGDCHHGPVVGPCSWPCNSGPSSSCAACSCCASFGMPGTGLTGPPSAMP